MSRTFAAFPERFATQRFTFENRDAYSVFRLTFPTLSGGKWQMTIIQSKEVPA